MAARWRRMVGSFALALVLLALASIGRAETPAERARAATEALSTSATIEATAAGVAVSPHQYRVRQWIRQRVVSETDLEKYRLCLAEDWQCAAADKPVAVVIHGFNSTPERNAGLLIPVRAANFPCATFAYPNDYQLPTAAELLSQNLRQFTRDYPDRRLVLICHSTGGLVARACIENPALDPGNVDRLIMIAPPTHGSQLARVACGTDLWEHWLSRKDGTPWTRMHDSIVDGLGEAADDLCPESPFLRELNARPRNPRVRYSIVLGTRAAVNDAEIVWIRQNVCEKLQKVPGVEGHAERFDALLADMDEVVEGKGDGVVAVKRGRLEGVDDVVEMPFCHMAVGGPADDQDMAALYQVILSRLQ